MYPDPQRLENTISIRDAMRQIGQKADAIVEFLDVRIEDEYLDGITEAPHRPFSPAPVSGQP
jgi:hypothetical protein